jgi:hypothetical protein
MIRNLISVLLAVVITFTSICCPAYASTENDRQDSGGIWNWLGAAITGAATAEVTRIVVCTLVIPELPVAAIPCGAALAVDTTGAAAAVTSQAFNK